MDTGAEIYGHFGDFGGTLYGMLSKWIDGIVCASYIFWICNEEDIFLACFTLAHCGSVTISYVA